MTDQEYERYMTGDFEEQEVERHEHRLNAYRPDETELFQDLKEEAYWDESHREFEQR